MADRKMIMKELKELFEKRKKLDPPKSEWDNFQERVKEYQKQRDINGVAFSSRIIKIEFKEEK